MPPGHYTSILTFTRCGHKTRLSCPSCEITGGDGRECSDPNMRTIEQKIDKWSCHSCRARWKSPLMRCTSILTYIKCGHKKEFYRPCGENVGSDGRRCSDDNLHTTQQTNYKWPCPSCREESLKLHGQFRRDTAENKHGPPTSLLIRPLEEQRKSLDKYPSDYDAKDDINKDLQAESVDEPTRQERIVPLYTKAAME
ncbi:hypothetical protein E4U59_004181 [Claviceps monticola]|nr:hypothetical protein E4U59_004181 [Claviceps monticola]